MDRFYCPPAALPEHLYRVQYPSSRTILSGNGLEARDTNFFYSTDEIRDFRQSIINQLTWGHRGDQPYITCFSDEKHAQNWALKEPWTKGEGQNWTLLTINTRKMSGTAVFKLSELVKSFSLSLPDGARQHVQGAYLCLHSVPTSAIIRQASVEEVEEGRII